MQIYLPNNWQPRDYQRPFWDYLENGGLLAYEVAHRRWGKDDVTLHWTACASQQRIGTYWHLLPQASQARKAIWEAINPHTGKNRIDEAFPEEIRSATRQNEMFIKFRNGSTWQVVGSDNYNSLVGSPPIGVVMSEWALAKPQAWGYLRPILRENGGWAAFITTPRGKNHAYRMFEGLKDTQGVFLEVSDATKTSVFTQEDLDSERDAYVAEHGPQVGKALFEQEYMCSFDAAIVGAIFAKEIQESKDAGRITKVPYDPARLVFTSWDIGRTDSTAIWFYQKVGSEVRYIDYHEDSGPNIMEYLAVLKGKGYSYDCLYMPHDADHANLMVLQGKSIADYIRQNGFNVKIIKRTANIMNRINAGKVLLKKAYFDAEKCGPGLDALTHYHWAYNERLENIKSMPEHDWSSHGADSFCYDAETMNDEVNVKKAKLKIDHRGIV